MENNSLEKLIATLKTEAVETAEKESQKIIHSARLQAEKILEAAKAEKKKLISEAKHEAQGIISNGERALQQAARDLNISVRNQLINRFEQVLEKEIDQNFSSDLMKTAILKVVENIGSQQIQFQLPEQFATELAQYIHAQVQNAEETIKISTTFSKDNQLAITKTDEGWTYQIGPKEVATLLKSSLIEKWVEILNKID
ncbi:MAG: hypothetical protein AAFO07_23520 [Bacteroidota bacterium]